MSEKKGKIETFEVVDTKFYILEQRYEEETGNKGKTEIKVNAWVFQNEKDAILELNSFIVEEEVDLENKLDESIEYLSSRYNLQEVQIEPEKYNMKAISWLKIALIGMADKK